MARLDIALIASRLIAIPSLSGKEAAVTFEAKIIMQELGWNVQSFPVAHDRENILVTFGSPRILFTTHLDIVPAPEQLFSPRIEEGVLYGRGACDAKGIAATMIATAYDLLQQGAHDFALLFVVGEEVDGIGASQAAKDLAGYGIEYIVNGEPTEGKLMLAHKGIIDFELICTGRACHSGYPELGIDANLILIEALNRLRLLDLGVDPIMGAANLNLGVIRGGVAQNVVSPRASVVFSIRTVTQSQQVIELVEKAVMNLGSLRVLGATDPVGMMTLPGFENDVAAYCTDIPNFAPLGAKTLLYGPGSIFDAHTDREKVTLDQLAEANAGYQKIYWGLQ